MSFEKVLRELKRFYTRHWRTDIKIITHKNAKWLLDRRNRVDRRIICGGYEGQQFNYLFSMPKDEIDAFCDIGANLGLYTVQAKLLGRIKDFYAFEPDIRNYAQLLANLYLNNMLLSVKVHGLGLSDKEGEVSFEMYPANSTGQSRIVQSDSATEKAEFVKIKTMPLDSLLSYKNKKLVLKIDVEGHELSVLNGARETLKNNICYLQIEAWPEEQEQLKKYMESIGYLNVNNIKEDFYFTNDSKFLQE